MKKLIALFVLAASALFPAALAQDLTGAGASFPFPLYSKMFDEYNSQFGVQVNYQSIGSGGGQRQLLEKTVNFAASDAALTDEQLQDYEAQNGSPVLHIPMALGAVVLAYNFEPMAPNPQQPLQLSGDVIADIFLGNITNWNDEAIQSLNPDVELPDIPISVAHRSDGSGTTYTFVEYLSKVSDAWSNQVGVGTSVDWPTGSGGKGNEGVAGLVDQIPGSIGYVELIYAVQNGLNYASIENQAGNFVMPDLQSTSVAGDVAVPEDGRFSITDTSAEQGYPIATYTYVLVYQDLGVTTSSMEQAQQLKDLLVWMSHDAQQYNEGLEYGSLPQKVRDFDVQQLDKLTYSGQALPEASMSMGGGTGGSDMGGSETGGSDSGGSN